MKRLFITLALAAVGCASLAAQSNDYIDRVLAAPVAEPAQVAYLVALASGAIPDSATEDEALSFVRGEGWPLPPEGSEGVRLDLYTHLLVTAFGIKGGFMYRLVPSPRYAFRELRHMGIVAGRPDPSRLVSGEEVLRLLGNMLAWGESK